MMADLPIKEQLHLYAESVMAIPLQILAIFRQNGALGISKDKSSDLAETVLAAGSNEAKKGYTHGNGVVGPENVTDNFVEKDFPIELFKNEDLIYRYNQNLEKSHFAQNWDLSNKQILFFSRIKELIEKQGGKLVFIKPNFPSDNTPTADVPRNTPNDLQSVPILVVPETWLTGKYDLETKRIALIDDGHRNLNGMNLFTKTITPALLQLYNE